MPLASTVAELVDHDVPDGLRGSLREYLIQRVPEGRRYGYVRTVTGWLKGSLPSVWRLPTGGRALQSEWPRVLGAALDDLAGSDESKMSRPTGDPANLKTKINVLLRQEEGRDRTDRGTATGAAPGAAGQGIGANQGAFEIES